MRLAASTALFSRHLPGAELGLGQELLSGLDMGSIGLGFSRGRRGQTGCRFESRHERLRRDRDPAMFDHLSHLVKLIETLLNESSGILGRRHPT